MIKDRLTEKNRSLLRCIPHVYLEDNRGQGWGGEGRITLESGLEFRIKYHLNRERGGEKC